MNKEVNDPSLKINKLLLKYSNKQEMKDNLIQKDTTSQILNLEGNKKQKEICKQIKNELNKRDKEKSIIFFDLICLLFNLILLGIG